MFTPKKEPSFALLLLHPPECEECSEDYDPVDVFGEIYSFTDLIGRKEQQIIPCTRIYTAWQCLQPCTGWRLATSGQAGRLGV